MLLSKAAVNEFIAGLSAEELPISPVIGELAIGAAMTYGKAVGHPADLNFVDCFSYGCAKATGNSLFYNGNVFFSDPFGVEFSRIGRRLGDQLTDKSRPRLL